MKDKAEQEGDEGFCSKDKLAFWRKKGFTEEHVFPGEYVLLIHPDTLDKVRVYENGDVWVSNRRTGEYEKSSDNAMQQETRS